MHARFVISLLTIIASYFAWFDFVVDDGFGKISKKEVSCDDYYYYYLALFLT